MARPLTSDEINRLQYNGQTGIVDDDQQPEADIRCTDAGNAELLVRSHGDDLLYCYPWNTWLVWDGKRFRIDNTGESERRAKSIARSLYGEAEKCNNPGQRTKIAEWAITSERSERIAAMLKMARSEKQIPVLPERLDSDAWKLNCATGVVDLKTGELFKHERHYMMSCLCPTGYTRYRSPPCPLWEAFLNRIFADNQGLIQFLQRLLGYALVGKVYEHVLPVFYGKGANGKSVLVETLLRVLGPDYAIKAAPDLLLAKRNETHPCDKADLFGKRLIVCTETDDGRRLAESTAKELSGGDTIKARRMRENFWQFEPSHLAILVSNFKPRVQGTDNGIWRRLKLVPFDVTIPVEEQDNKLTEKLFAERAGILLWLVNGCLAWQANGLGQPPEVDAATADYRSEQDTLGLFIDERCQVEAVLNCKASDLYAAYTDWAKKAGEHAVSQRRFGSAMTERGFDRYTNAGVWYRGIGTGEGF